MSSLETQIRPRKEEVEICARIDGKENRGNAEVMWQFSPEQAPVKMALAQEFAIFDRYFASVPSPSTPNHLFWASAT